MRVRKTYAVHFRKPSSLTATKKKSDGSGRLRGNEVLWIGSVLFFTLKESRPRASESLTQLHHGARGLFRRGQRYTRRPHRRWGTQGSKTHRRDERARVAGARGKFSALLLPASRPRPFAARPVLTLLSADIRSRSSSLTQVSGRFVASKLAPGGARLKPACEIARASRFPRFPARRRFNSFSPPHAPRRVRYLTIPRPRSRIRSPRAAAHAPK